MNRFAQNVLDWFDQNGRKDLPWQQAIHPYRVWISEIMLQQTQVSTVIPYFERFMESFPSVAALAQANEDAVLKHWSGLGYYARARNLHRTARMVCEKHNGEFPSSLETLQSLPGIGRSTAGAILSIAHGQAHPILDGNVKRVLARFFAVQGWPGKAAVQQQLWALAEQQVPASQNADYTQAMMDLGATVCTRTKPLCTLCPLASDCQARALSKQTDFPGRKPKRSLPEKEAIVLLIINHAREVLLKRRRPAGIWGGLWSFPQFEQQQQAEQYLSKCFGTQQTPVESPSFSLPGQCQSLQPLTHTFSHFRLTIQPWKVDLNQAGLTPLITGVMEPENTVWYNLENEFDGGLAAPVTRLLETLRRESAQSSA